MFSSVHQPTAMLNYSLVHASAELPGDYSARGTPLPISNRVVKSRSADGTGFLLVE